MKIAYVVPGPMDHKEAARRGAILKEWAAPDTAVDIRRVEEGPASIESMYEEYLSIPAAAQVVFQLEQEGYAAFWAVRETPVLTLCERLQVKCL